MVKRGKRRPSRQRKGAEKRGRRAETFAVWWLRLKGYAILARRAKTPKGEIDIIARRAGTLVFVEVKARQSFELGQAAITPRQAKRIIAGAKYWLAGQAGAAVPNIRFDIMLIRSYLLIRHLKNAFDEKGKSL